MRDHAISWEESFDELDAPSEALLNLLSWFAHETIPVRLWETPAALRALSDGVVRLTGSQLQTSVDVEAIRSALIRCGLIQPEPDRAAFRVHHLIQDVARERLPPIQSDAWLRDALEVVSEYLPDDYPPDDVNSSSRWDSVSAHVTSLIGYAEKAGIAHPTSALLNGLALLRKSRGHFGEAEPLYRRALAIDEHSFGLDHPEVARDLNNLAQLFQTMNRWTEAEPLMRRALAIDEHFYGREHPRVAIDLNNLAQLLQYTNRMGEAEPLMHRALAIDEQSYGTNHPRVAIRLNNLAQLLQETERLSEAEPLMRRALAIDERSYGGNHPRVAIQLNNLARLLQATNRRPEAEPLYRRAISVTEQSYGAEHPEVAINLSNFATLLVETNRLREAEPLLRRALAINEQSYGSDHPDVAVDLNNLAQLLMATRRVAEAEPLMRRHLEIFCAFTRQTGHRHPHLRAAVLNYERLLRAMHISAVEIPRRLSAAGVDPTWLESPLK